MTTLTQTTSTRATLTRAALAGLAPDRRPLVDPRDPRPRIVHIGLGAVHRAHQAVYTEIAAARSDEPWGIVAVAPRSPVTAVRAQGCLYSVAGPSPTSAADLAERADLTASVAARLPALRAGRIEL